MTYRFEYIGPVNRWAQQVALSGHGRSRGRKNGADAKAVLALTILAGHSIGQAATLPGKWTRIDANRARKSKADLPRRLRRVSRQVQPV